MKRLLLCLFLLVISTSASDLITALKFSDKDLIKIKQNHAPSCALRIADFNKQYKKWKLLSKEDQLERINFYINGMLGQYDSYTYNQEEYWSTPKEFLINGLGDCEDYVGLKYFTLISLGFNKDSLFYAAVLDNYSGGYHMVLLYSQQNKPAVVLDNLSHLILSLKVREDLKFLYAFNEEGVYKINKDEQIVPIMKKEPKFEDLLERIKKNNK